MNSSLKESALLARQNDQNSVLRLARENYVLILMGLNLGLALVLRLYNLAANPVGLNQDEAVNGVDAFALGQTLRDHHGNFLPFMLESFDDWASPGLTYLSVPFVKVLGLSVFSIRLPVALAGVATVLLMYPVVKRLTGRQDLSLLASFLLCVMPWHIIASRWAIPTNIVPFFLLLTLYLYLQAVASEFRAWKYLLVGLCAAVLTYTYPTQKMFVPMFLGLLGLVDILNRTAWKLLLKKHLCTILPWLALSAPIYILTMLEPGKYNARFSSVSIFQPDSNPIQGFLVRYFSYLGPVFNFGKEAGSITDHLPGIENTYNFLAVFYYAGITWSIYILISKRPFFVSKFALQILLGWLLLFPVPASLTLDYYHNLRAMHGLLLTIIFVAIGLGMLFDLLKSQAGRVIGYAILLAVSVFYLAVFWTAYWGTYPQASGPAFQKGAGEYSEYLRQNAAEFTSVKVDSRISYPYIYYLFYAGKEPLKFNHTEINSSIVQDGYKVVPRLGKYSFVPILPEDLAGAVEIYTVKDERGVTWYRVFARDTAWFVVRPYPGETNFEPSGIS